MAGLVLLSPIAGCTIKAPPVPPGGVSTVHRLDPPVAANVSSRAGPIADTPPDDDYVIHKKPRRSPTAVSDPH